MCKNLVKELKDFVMRGNVIDMAVGIIIGASFGKIVDSLVKDVIMPPIGMILGKVDFTNLYFQLSNRDVIYKSLEEAQEAGAVTVNYGLFINTIISFLIVAFAVFALIKCINTLKTRFEKQEAEDAVATTKECPYCKSTININATRCPHCTSELN